MKSSTQRFLAGLIFCTFMYTVISIQGYRKFIIGGLFPIHEKGKEHNACGAIMKEKGIQRMEAMNYAIQKINSNSQFWQFTLEPRILDTCSSDSYALTQSLKFLHDDCTAITSQRMVVTGVIGAANSPVSESVATIFRLFKIPQISYASTSTELDDKHKYPYFFRVVPSDIFQIKAITDLLRRLNWNFLSVVAAKGEYGEKAVEELEKYTGDHDICFATKNIIKRNAGPKDYADVIDRLLENYQAKAVVVFLNEDKLRTLLTTAREKNVTNGRLLWLGSDSWGAKSQVVAGVESVVEGAITILPMKFTVNAYVARPETHSRPFTLTATKKNRSINLDFDEYFTKLKPTTHNANVWFKEFWENQFDCNLENRPLPTNSRMPDCTGEETLSSNYTQEGLVPMVIDSVNVMAQALKDMCHNESRVCSDENAPPLGDAGDKLVDYIKKVNIKSCRGQGINVSFDENRSVEVNYTIYQFRRNSTDPSQYGYFSIGSWNKESRLNLSELPYQNEDSSCGVPCEPGYERIIEKNNKCCWTCNLCNVTSYVQASTHRCQACPPGLVPDDNSTSCIYMEPIYFGSDMGSPWIAVPFVFAILGLICSLVTYIAFWVYHNTPIIMASGRELCHLIFFGVFLCYTFTFMMVSQPTPLRCGINRVSLGLGLSICYSAILTKTNRISRIFNRTMRSAKRPKYVTPKSQLVICLSLVMIQLTLSAIWILLQLPEVISVANRRPIVLVCNMDDTSVCLALAFNVVLIIMCTIYAYKTRKIPENFNEAKYISFVMYSTCIIWMAFAPTYFSISSDYKVKSTLLSMSVSMSGSVALVCIFFPKLYIVIFQPHKNVRFVTTSNNDTVAYTAPIRFIKTTQAANVSRETKLGISCEKPRSQENDTEQSKLEPCSNPKTPDKRKTSRI